MCARTVGSQVGVVDSWVQRDRSRRADVVVRVLKDELLQLGSLPLTLVEDALVVNRASRTLDSHMGAKIEVKLEWMSATRLHQSAGQGVTVAIALARFREEANVVALTGNDHSELGELLATQLLEALLHVMNLLFENSSVLSLADAVTDVENTLRSSTLSNLLHPITCHEAKVFVNVGSRDHLDTVAVGLNFSPVLYIVDVGGDGNGSKGGSFTRGGSRSGMRNISTNDHGRNRSRLGCNLRDKLRLGDRGDTAELSVDLHTDVGNVLWRGSHDVLGLDDLRSHTETNIARLLDATVDVHVAIVDDEEQQVRRLVVLVAGLVPHLLNHLSAILKVTGADPRLLAVLGMGENNAAMRFVDLDELLDEGFYSLRWGAATTLNGANAPCLDRAVLVTHSELARIQAPSTSDHIRSLDRRLLGTGTEVDSRGRQDAGCDLGRAGVDLKVVVTEIGIARPIEEADSLLNSRPALLGEGNCELDHLGRLSVAQLGVVALVGIDLEDIDGHVDVTVANLLGHPDDWDVGDAVYIVLLLEVLCDRDLLGTVVWIWESGLSGVHVDKLINGPLGWFLGVES